MHEDVHYSTYFYTKCYFTRIFYAFPTSSSLISKIGMMQDCHIPTPIKSQSFSKTIPAGPHTQCTHSNHGAARSNCAHLSHFMQLLEQLNLANSLAKLLKAYTEADTTQFFSYTEPEKEQNSLSDIIWQTLKMGTVSLPPNLFLISSKPKCLSKMFLSFYFSVSSLNLHSSQGSKLLTLMHRNKSRSKLKLYYCMWGVGILLYYMKFYLLILQEIDYYKQFSSKLNSLSANNSSSKWAP